MRFVACFIIVMFFIPKAFAQPADQKLVITALTGNFFIYTTYNTYEGNAVPAHGMYLVTPDAVVLFDTPWDTTQFQPLLDSIATKHQKKVSTCIATHWHSDRTEGLAYYKKLGIKTYTTVLTDELCKKNNKKTAEYLMAGDTLFNIGGYAFEIYYPGEGHTADNIIVWFAKEKILYGGCLIKGAEAENLGYLGDANIATYKTTLINVSKKCRNPKYIIVSHHNWTNINSLKHSIRLAGKLKKQQK
jgi:metallo-beta-lactamase class B